MKKKEVKQEYEEYKGYYIGRMTGAPNLWAVYETPDAVQWIVGYPEKLMCKQWIMEKVECEKRGGIFTGIDWY